MGWFWRSAWVCFWSRPFLCHGRAHVGLVFTFGPLWRLDPIGGGGEARGSINLASASKAREGPNLGDLSPGSTPPRQCCLGQFGRSAEASPWAGPPTALAAPPSPMSGSVVPWLRRAHGRLCMGGSSDPTGGSAVPIGGPMGGPMGGSAVPMAAPPTPRRLLWAHGRLRRPCGTPWAAPPSPRVAPMRPCACPPGGAPPTPWAATLAGSVGPMGGSAKPIGIVQIWPDVDQAGPEFGQLWPERGKFRPTLILLRARPNVGHLRTSTAGFLDLRARREASSVHRKRAGVISLLVG